MFAFYSLMGNLFIVSLDILDTDNTIAYRVPIRRIIFIPDVH